MLASDDIIARAASALSQTAGRSIRLEDVQLLSQETRRNFVARAVARDDAGQARSVIVKAARSGYKPAAENALRESGLVREWVATAYIGQTAPGRDHGAALLAGDVEAGVLVFEDLGKDVGLLVGPLLRGTAEEAERALVSYATALGRLHADTIGCLEPHHATYQAIFGASRTLRPTGWRVEAEADVVAGLLGHAPPAGELALLSSRLAEPGPWLSLVHGDPCPDNVLFVEGRARLIDYEWARPAHALLDGLYWRVGFPTCWCAGHAPTDVASRVDAAYRAELGRAIPLALDDTVFRTEQAYLTAVWLFTALSWRLGKALEADEKWGIWSIRGRLLWYLEHVIATTSAAGVLAGLGDSARAWLKSLRERWPEAQPLGYFPAFSRADT